MEQFENPQRQGTIDAIQLHVAERVTGEVRGYVNAEKAKVKMEFDTLGAGIWIRGRQTNLLVPFSNIRGVYVTEEDQERNLVQTR